VLLVVRPFLLLLLLLSMLPLLLLERLFLVMVLFIGVKTQDPAHSYDTGIVVLSYLYCLQSVYVVDPVGIDSRD
jgi:hypothetical protein